MKKIFILVALSAAVLTASARHKSDGGFKIGMGGAFSNTWLFNTNVSNTGDDFNYKVSTGGQIGLSMAYDFQEKVGMGGGIFYSMHNQKYDLGKGTYEYKTALSYIDIPLLLRVGNLSQGVFFEIGPQIGILTGAKEDFTSIIDPTDNYSGKNIKSDFNGFDFAGCIGFGGIFDLSDDWCMTAGLRFGWSFTDATVEYTQDQLKAKIKNKETLSFTDVAAHTSYKEDPVTHINLFDYQPTNRAFGALTVSIMYKIQ